METNVETYVAYCVSGENPNLSFFRFFLAKISPIIITKKKAVPTNKVAKMKPKNPYTKRDAGMLVGALVLLLVMKLKPKEKTPFSLYRKITEHTNINKSIKIGIQV